VGNMFRMVILEFLISGVIVSSITKYIAEKYMIKSEKKGNASGGTGAFTGNKSGINESQVCRVEPMYAFDIHCNGFFPILMISYVLQVSLDI